MTVLLQKSVGQSNRNVNIWGFLLSLFTFLLSVTFFFLKDNVEYKNGKTKQNKLAFLQLLIPHPPCKKFIWLTNWSVIEYPSNSPSVLICGVSPSWVSPFNNYKRKNIILLNNKIYVKNLKKKKNCTGNIIIRTLINIINDYISFC